jgi:hypothetical protein
LYGKAIDQKIDFQVKEIDQAAQKILHLISTGKILQISNETTTLKIYIQDLLHFHRLSKENLEIVNKANDILKMAFHHIP